MNLDLLVPGIVGAMVGVVGWLLVGLYIQRRQFVRQARNAGRAVYFELDMNRLNVDLALEYGAFTPLGRSSFERLLPELATWLEPDELRTIVAAYVAHAGYDQAGSDTDLPVDVRRQALTGIMAAQRRAIDLLRRRVFSAAEVRRLDTALVQPPDAPILDA